MKSVSPISVDAIKNWIVEIYKLGAGALWKQKEEMCYWNDDAVFNQKGWIFDQPENCPTFALLDLNAYQQCAKAFAKKIYIL